MSRLLFGAACSLLVLFGLGFGAHLAAQEENDLFGGERSARRGAESAELDTQTAEERIEAVLAEQLKAPLTFFDTPLTQVIRQLQDEYDIPILIDNAALDELAISPETEVSASLRNISLRSALELMFKQPRLEDLTFVIDEEVLMITTEERANETMLVKVYRVDDFEHFFCDQKSSENPDACYASLPKVIVSCVQFDSWKENGTGAGELYLMKPGMLVVAQTRFVHHKIEDLLTQLRAVKAEIEGANSGSAHSDSGRY